MFNLIDTVAAKRRTPRFLAITFSAYGAILAAVIVSSILFYRPALASSLEILTLVTPPLPPAASLPERPKTSNNQQNQIISETVPPPRPLTGDELKQTPNPVYIDLSSGSDGVVGVPCEVPCNPSPAGIVGAAGPPNVTPPPAPPAPIKKAEPKPEPPQQVRLTSSVIQGKAINIPKPAYPHIAVIAKRQGTVEVEIVIDKEGRVISAVAVSGPDLLRAAAVNAAMNARFQPTILSGQPVIVQGVIKFNFTLNQ